MSTLVEVIPDPDDHQWLATEIVRLAERYPDRIGPKFWDDGHGRRCIIATINHDHPERFALNHDGNEFNQLWLTAAIWNDAGTPWGQIPRLMGLVPGEEPESIPVEKPPIESPKPVEEEELVTV